MTPATFSFVSPCLTTSTLNRCGGDDAVIINVVSTAPDVSELFRPMRVAKNLFREVIE
jgi:hypothetical protein